MQLELFVNPRSAQSAPNHLAVGSASVRLWFVHNRRARRYVLRLKTDGSARVTIPRGGSITEAKCFADRNAAWLEKQLCLQRMASRAKPWVVGTEILFRGEPVRLQAAPDLGAHRVCLGDQIVKFDPNSDDLRPAIERHLWRLAADELPPRVFELAAAHGFTVGRVTVRSQRSRWGSCSRRGTISLNWRLVQAPVFVRDYIVLHELAHLKHMNHSRRYWREVARICPEFANAERWLKANSKLLL